MSDSPPPTPNNNYTIKKRRSKPHKFLPIRFLANILASLAPSAKSKPGATTQKPSAAPVKDSPRHSGMTTTSTAADQEEMAVGAPEAEAADVAAMKRAVKELHFGRREDKEAAAEEIRRLARADPGKRRLLAELGVIPQLVAMAVESEEDQDRDRRRRLAVDALVEMANATFKNKALIVKAGLLSRLPHITTATQDLAEAQNLTRLILSISSLAKTQFPVATRPILPFLIRILNADETTDEVKLTCIATLYNLSTKLDNTKAIVSSGAVHSLLTLSTDRSTSEGALATLGNLVKSPIGKAAIEEDPLAPKAFVEGLTWDDKPRSQELAAYLLMVLAHGSTTQRQKMAGLGVVPKLLEVALLGSPLARKRALKLLQWFRDETQTKIAVHSGPQARRIELSSSSMDRSDAKGGRKAVKDIVKQSLDMNMELIMRRARGLENSSRLKALVASSSSKSLPY